MSFKLSQFCVILTIASLPFGTVAQAESKPGNYSHELIGRIDLTNSSGSLTSQDASTDSRSSDTSFNLSNFAASLSYGYFLSPQAEPFVELDYENFEQKIGTYAAKKHSTDFGLGMLFNVASGGKDGAQGFATSSFIPYGGLMVASSNAKGQDGTDTKANTKDADLITKLIGGVRYIPVPNLAVHFSVRLSHQASSSTADAAGTQGGSTKKTTVEIHLLNLSLLF